MRSPVGDVIFWASVSLTSLTDPDSKFALICIDLRRRWIVIFCMMGPMLKDNITAVMANNE